MRTRELVDLSVRALRWVRQLAVFSALVEIGIHLFVLEDHLHEKPYIGGLFIASAVILTAVIVALVEPGTVRTGAYLVGGLVSIGMFGAFIASRTVGLPLGYLEGWFTDYALGIPSIVFDAIFVGCALTALHPQRRARRRVLLLGLGDREADLLEAGQP
jgi:hypothetical protein